MANYHLYVYVYKFDFWALAFVLCTVCSFAPPQPARADLEPLNFGKKIGFFFVKTQSVAEQAASITNKS
jgi:hypothetical protein